MKAVKSILMMPVWVMSVFTQEKYFGNNPVIGSVLLNKCGLHVFRVVLSRGIYLFKQALMCFTVAKEDRIFLRKNGYLLKENFLPPEQFTALETEILGYEGNFRQIKEGDTLTERAFMTSATMGDVPILTKTLFSKPFFNLTRYSSARNERPAVYIERITQHHDVQAKDSQKDMHKDTFHPTLKSWLYISDVTEENGPFVYVAGSHRLTLKRLTWEYRLSVERAAQRKTPGVPKGGAFRITNDDLAKLGCAVPRRFTVKKNTLIIADTFGLHCRGNAKTSQPRTGIWTSSRVNPFNPFPGWNSKILTRFRDHLLTVYYDRKKN